MRKIHHYFKDGFLEITSLGKIKESTMVSKQNQKLSSNKDPFLQIITDSSTLPVEGTETRISAANKEA